MKSQGKGFTLIEVLVVVAIIALLVSILLPSLARAREAAIRVHCAANFTNIGKAWFMYAGDHRDYYPACWSGGFWSFVLDFNRNYFDKRKLGGDVFMCPTWEGGSDIFGKPYGWDNLTKITGSLGSAVQTGYAFWTHLISDPYVVKDGSIVPGEFVPIREWTRTHLPPNSVGSWAEEMVDNRGLVPWLTRTTDIGGQVRDMSDMSTFTYFRRRTSPSDQRMSWDLVQHSTVDNGTGGFGPKTTRHFFRNKATGANVLYGDGHVRWRPFKEMVEVNMGGGYKQFY